MARSRKTRAKSKTKTPPAEKPQAAVAGISVLSEDNLRDILRRLSLADLLCAALACHRWRRVAAGCLPRAAPLLGYFFQPVKTSLPAPIRETKGAHYDAVFAPLDASSPRLSLDFAPDASRYELLDCHEGLLVLEPTASVPKAIHPRLLVSTRPPTAALFSAAAAGHGARRPPMAQLQVVVDFDPYWFDSFCVHAAGKMYWHICNSDRVLALDPATLQFSYLQAPAGLPGICCKYRIGETPDGRLCTVTVEDQVMRLWVRAEIRTSDDGWVLEREMNLRKVYDTVPGLPRDMRARVASIWSPTSTRGTKIAVHPDIGIRALLVRSQHREAGAPSDQEW
ncbi:hypothetical protein ACQ4PT_050681 [Festuca glaucescens]